MRSVGELGAIEHSQGPRFEASHRRQFAGIGHPDADYIASFSPDVTGRLLAVAEAAKCWLDSNDEDRQEELNVLIASLENVEL
jgi:hypothetical protein